jgi:cyanate permease
MLVYGSLYVFILLLPVLVVRQADLFHQAMKGYVLVMLVGYVGFLVYPASAPRSAEVPATTSPRGSSASLDSISRREHHCLTFGRISACSTCEPGGRVLARHSWLWTCVGPCA